MFNGRFVFWIVNTFKDIMGRRQREREGDKNIKFRQKFMLTRAKLSQDETGGLSFCKCFFIVLLVLLILLFVFLFLEILVGFILAAVLLAIGLIVYLLKCRKNGTHDGDRRDRRDRKKKDRRDRRNRRDRKKKRLLDKVFETNGIRVEVSFYGTRSSKIIKSIRNLDIDSLKKEELEEYYFEIVKQIIYKITNKEPEMIFNEDDSVTLRYDDFVILIYCQDNYIVFVAYEKVPYWIIKKEFAIENSSLKIEFYGAQDSEISDCIIDSVNNSPSEVDSIEGVFDIVKKIIRTITNKEPKEIPKKDGYVTLGYDDYIILIYYQENYIVWVEVWE